MSVVKRVVCALSGGVDSAVSALLLRNRGFEVIGVHMFTWDSQDEADVELSYCTKHKDESDARQVCKQLGIDEFYVVNYVKEFWSGVFLNLLENYRKGRTIVPDLDCNRLVKFGLLQEFAFEKLGADAFATGHYASTSQGDFLDRLNGTERVRLLRARDPLKDQTYFLSALNQKQLKRTMFPVGSLIKTEVRELAKKAELCVANKEESMGICSVGKKRNFEDFLSKYIEPAPCRGRFVHIDTGEEVEGAHHTGIHNFTIGKRILSTNDCDLSVRFPNRDGLFVVELDSAKQIVYFCHGSYHRRLFARRIVVSQPHWISGLCTEEIVREQAREDPRSTFGNLRFSIQRAHPQFPCKFGVNETGDWVLESWAPIRAAAPGQTCAFYSLDGKECLGYAEILRAIETI